MLDVYTERASISINGKHCSSSGPKRSDFINPSRARAQFTFPARSIKLELLLSEQAVPSRAQVQTPYFPDPLQLPSVERLQASGETVQCATNLAASQHLSIFISEHQTPSNQCAFERIDFTIVANVPKGMCTLPGWEGVGGEAAVDQPW